ncbi:hypothetical protein RASY3_08480 [Ruminococcus albus SY3]|uniref:Prepilin-type N-terminal cleavage/methylation domain-containing protein n=1 Tax=Ruminococcus albus SY3 TaxID=1341156 RepID=A0A011V432_RUMAL|nr:type II secretion system protein [Ruminococcus albus]EXM38718.1 hypothetical protein RASY3_18865 [Ruminococcus albus SY3]EXM40232.1 hypothetical protein RASY3_08480 [Ruminococcus albus SY3]
MKKNNKNGFTLIELVIVATIMVMIMGAILNWIRPMNRFYQRTQALSDSNDVGSLLMDSVDDELRYATNVVILQNYEGVPQLSGGFLVDSSGNSSYSAKFTDVIIIDNNAIRGSRFPDYDPNGTVAHRKGARGCIIKATARDIIDTDRMRCLGLGGEALYSDYGCHFDASLNTFENGASSVTIDMELTRPTRNGAVYVFDKFGYNQQRDFELVNVNLKKNTMKADFYTSTGNGKPIDYNKFARASFSGSNINAESMYSGGPDNTFTYILYTKDVPEEKQVTITLIDQKTGLKAANPEKITSGITIPENIYNNWKTIGEGKTTSFISSGNGKYVRTLFVKIVDGQDNPIENYLTTPILSDMEFFIVTTDQSRENPSKIVKFMDRFDGGGNDHSPEFVEKNSAPIWDDDDKHIIDNIPDSQGDKDHVYKFVGWHKDPTMTGAPSGDASNDLAAGWFVNGEEYFTDEPFYAIYEKKPSVTFQFEAADPSEVPSGFSVGETVVVIDNFDASGYQNDSEMTYRKQQFADAFANIDSGRTFSHWTFEGSDGSEKDISEINKDTDLTENGVYTIKAYSKDNSHPDAYEVTIVIDKIPEETWNRVISFSSNPEARWLITNEDGTETYSSNEPNEPVISSWCMPSNVTFTDGMVLKLYVFDDYNKNVDIQIGWYETPHKITVNNNCTLTYDGTNWSK